MEEEQEEQEEAQQEEQQSSFFESRLRSCSCWPSVFSEMFPSCSGRRSVLGRRFIYFKVHSATSWTGEYGVRSFVDEQTLSPAAGLIVQDYSARAA